MSIYLFILDNCCFKKRNTLYTKLIFIDFQNGVVFNLFCSMTVIVRCFEEKKEETPMTIIYNVHKC